MSTSTRRAFLGQSAAILGAGASEALAARKKKVPIALEMYSVRDECKKDMPNALRTVAKMGYEGVEIYSIYFDYTPQQIKEIRSVLDESRMPCLSTHNGAQFLSEANLSKAIEYNQMLGSKHIIMASAGKVENAAGWQKVADRLNQVSEKLKPMGMRTGFHNHATEFKEMEGQLPWEILAKNTHKDVILQLDIGTILSAGKDPVDCMKRYPGRTASMHLKEYSTDPAKGYRVLLGEGAGNWKAIFDTAEKVGGIEHYIIEQEGSDYPAFETVDRCLKIMRKMRA